MAVTTPLVWSAAPLGAGCGGTFPIPPQGPASCPPLSPREAPGPVASRVSPWQGGSGAAGVGDPFAPCVLAGFAAGWLRPGAAGGCGASCSLQRGAARLGLGAAPLR